MREKLCLKVMYPISGIGVWPSTVLCDNYNTEVLHSAGICRAFRQHALSASMVRGRSGFFGTVSRRIFFENAVEEKITDQ